MKFTVLSILLFILTSCGNAKFIEELNHKIGPFPEKTVVMISAEGCAYSRLAKSKLMKDSIALLIIEDGGVSHIEQGVFPSQQFQFYDFDFFPQFFVFTASKTKHYKGLSKKNIVKIYRDIGKEKVY